MPSSTARAGGGQVARALGQAAADEHDEVGAELGRLCDRAAVVVDRVRGGEEAAAAQAGDGQAGVADEPRGGGGAARLGDLVAPQADLPDAGAGAALGGLGDAPAVRGDLVEAQPLPGAHVPDPRDGEQRAHARRGELAVGQQPGLVGEHERLGEVGDRAGALQPADHPEVVLVAGQPGQEDDPGLVGRGRRGEQVAGERDGGGEDRLVGVLVAVVERRQRRGGGGRDRVEDAQQRVAARADQSRVVEVVAGVEPDAVRQRGRATRSRARRRAARS